MQDKVELLCSSIRRQFYNRTVVEGRKRNIDFGINLDIGQKGNEIWLTFTKGEESHVATIPIPFVQNGVAFISNNGVRRALCNYFLEEEQRELDFFSIMYYIICGEPRGIVSDNLVKKGPYIQQVVYGFESGNASTVIYNLQRAINDVVNRMPVHETDMNSWVMNQRLVIIDPVFDEIQDPKERLEYQIEKSKRYFPRGWTPIGLADGALADRNYTLKFDIRKLTPFGLRHHNPQRNLYSTLGMKGDELPRVRSISMQKLMDVGLTRKGWNLFTVFADIPDVFEDQIMVDESHADKFINYRRRYSCFGKLLVQEGDALKYRQVLSITDDEEKMLFDTVADKAWVEKIVETESNIGGAPVKTYHVLVGYRRHLKDGTKITNLHGNKGVIRLKKLGHAINPKTGEARKIDVLVSAKSIKKRKNFGQILEALANVVMDEDEIKIVEDDLSISMEQVENALEANGYPKDGSWQCETYAGALEGVCGTVFWGVTKDVEDQLWDRNDTVRRNGRDLRTAGLKFSTVEFRALITRFGKNNPITSEILSYVQGTEDLHEQIAILKSKRGEVPDDKPVLDAVNLKALVQNNGTLFSKEEIKGTVVDEHFHPDGFLMKLPLPYQVATDKWHRAIAEGIPQDHANDPDIKNVFGLDRIYIPAASLRKCWRHDTGKYGLSDLGVLINNIVKMAHRYIEKPEESINVRLLYMSIGQYFARVAMRMGTKRGEISTYGMAVRYPYSAKAVATLSNSLPKNTVEIHRDMARKLQVKTGDVVLAERFPCLGFMSIRPQQVKVTDDPLCRFTIRVSGNCLGSMSLDFDGDVLFLASFHSPEAKELLKKEWTNPNKSCYDVIKELNKKAGAPHTKSLVLQDYDLSVFEDLTNEEHAVLVKRATGVKSHTGPVIALAYNIMRILENSGIKDNQKTNVAIEVFLDKVGNSVFKQKHGVKSLHDIVIDAICMADVNTLVEHGFHRGTSTIICDIIKAKGREIGVRNVRSYHEWAKANGRSKLINRIVRQQNRIYFASRAALEGCALLNHLESPAVDWPSHMLKLVLSGKSTKIETELDKNMDSKYGLRSIKNDQIRKAGSRLWEYVKEMLSMVETRESVSSPSPELSEERRRALVERFLRRYGNARR